MKHVRASLGRVDAIFLPVHCNSDIGTHFLKKCQQMCLGQFVLIPRVSVYKDTPPMLIGAKTEIPCPSAQFNLTWEIENTISKIPTHTTYRDVGALQHVLLPLFMIFVLN